MDVAERLAAPLRKGEVFKQLCEDVGIEFDYSRTYECMSELRAKIAELVGEGWRYNFPQDTAHRERGLMGDMKDAAGELIEASFELGYESLEKAAMEAMDVAHVIESVLRKTEECGVDLDEVKAAVIEKNRARGYYGGDA